MHTSGAVHLPFIQEFLQDGIQLLILFTSGTKPTLQEHISGDEQKPFKQTLVHTGSQINLSLAFNL